MASKQNGLAYDLSLFEPDPIEMPQYAEGKKSVQNAEDDKNKVIQLDVSPYEAPAKRKHKASAVIAVGLILAIVAGVSMFVLRNNAIIYELNNQINAANALMENQENLEAQYQLRIDRKLTDEFVQEYAETKLGMTKANSAQKEFVSLTDGDKGEVVRGEGKESFLSRIARAFHI